MDKPSLNHIVMRILCLRAGFLVTSSFNYLGVLQNPYEVGIIVNGYRRNAAIQILPAIFQ